MEVGSLPKGRGKTKSLKDNLNVLFALAPSYSFPSSIPLTLMFEEKEIARFVTAVPERFRRQK